MENFSLYLKKFKVAVLIAVVGVAILAFFISKIVPAVQDLIKVQEDYKTATDSLADAERKLQKMRSDEERRLAEQDNLPKAFFKPITTGLDTEAAISDEFGEILQLIKENKIKTRSIQYDYDPQDDNFVKHVADKYHVCRVTAEVIATYSQFENFMRDLYKHEHFLEISRVEISPYQKNKKILLINVVLKLYAHRDPSSPPAVTSKPEAAAEGKAEAKPKDIKPVPTEEISPDEM